MIANKRCVAKLMERLDTTFIVGEEYDCEETKEHYIIVDKNGGKHPILKTGILAKHFEFWD